MNAINTNYGIRIKNILYRFKPRKSYTENDRDSEGFIFYVSGGHAFNFQNKVFKCKPYTFIYLPIHSKYKNRLLDENTEYYQIDFEMYIDNKIARFSSKPFVATGKSAKQLMPLIVKLYEAHCLNQNGKDILCISLLYQLFASIKTNNLSAKSNNKSLFSIQKSIGYIEKNYTLNTDMETIAQMSNMSLSNFEKIFKNNFDTSPIKYRNQLRIDMSKILLLGGKSINETAFETGFTDPYYFSKTFKSVTGKTPGQFIKKHE